MSDCMLTVVTATFNVIKAGRKSMLRRCVDSVGNLESHMNTLLSTVLLSMERWSFKFPG